MEQLWWKGDKNCKSHDHWTPGPWGMGIKTLKKIMQYLKIFLIREHLADELFV